MKERLTMTAKRQNQAVDQLPDATHLPLNALKAFVIRAKLAQEFDTVAWPKRDKSTLAKLRSFKKSILMIADDLDDDNLYDGIDGSLDQCLDFVAKRAATHTPPSIATRHERRLAQSIHKFIKEIRGVCCRTCSSKCGSNICSDNKNDSNLTIHRGGHCVAFVKKMFSDIDDFVCDLYTSHTSSILLKPSITLSTDTAHPHQDIGLFSEHSLSAMHDLIDRDEDSLLASNIVVLFKQKSFGWDGLCQLPYVLLHEFVCHAYQGIDHPRGPRVNASNKCAWTEGYMDKVALSLLSQEVGMNGRSSFFPPWLVSNKVKRERIRRRSEELHEKRYRPSSVLRDFEAEHLKLGRSAATLTLEAFEDIHFQNQPKAFRDWILFSLQLNKLEMPKAVRGQLVDDLCYFFENSESDQYYCGLRVCRLFLKRAGRNPLAFARLCHAIAEKDMAELTS